MVDYYELIKRFEPSPLDGEMLQFYVTRYEPDTLFEKLIYEKIEDGKTAYSFIVGNFGQGKTSFLNYWKSKMDKPYPRQYNLEALNDIPIVAKTVYDDNPVKFLYNVLKAIERGFKKNGWIYYISINQKYEKFFRYINQVVEGVLTKVERLGKADVESLKSALSFIAMDSEIPIVVMIDGMTSGPSLEILAQFLDMLLQGVSKMSFIITIVPEELQNVRKRFPYITNKFTEIRIPGYNFDEVKEVFRKRVYDVAKPENPYFPFTEDVIETIWRHFPVLRDTIKVAQRTLTCLAKGDELKKCVDIAIKEVEQAFEVTLLLELDELDRMILKVLAELGEAGPSEITKVLKERGYEVAKSTVHYRLKEPLTKKGIVERIGRGRRGKYRIVDKRLSDMIKYL